MNDQIELLSATEYTSEKEKNAKLDFGKLDFLALSKVLSDNCDNMEYKIRTNTIPIERIKVKNYE